MLVQLMWQFAPGFGVAMQYHLASDLKATDDQVSKLKEWAKEYQTAQFKSFADFKDLSNEEKAERRAKSTEEAWKAIGGVLKEDQVKRLKQIELQVGGAFVYSRKDVAEALKISDDQKEKIRDASQSMFKEMADLREEYGIKGFGAPKLDADKQKEYEKKSAAITKDLTTKIQGTLTDEQKTKWKEMTGEPFAGPCHMVPPGSPRLFGPPREAGRG